MASQEHPHRQSLYEEPPEWPLDEEDDAYSATEDVMASYTPAAKSETPTPLPVPGAWDAPVRKPSIEVVSQAAVQRELAPMLRQQEASPNAKDTSAEAVSKWLSAHPPWQSNGVMRDWSSVSELVQPRETLSPITTEVESNSTNSPSRPRERSGTDASLHSLAPSTSADTEVARGAGAPAAAEDAESVGSLTSPHTAHEEVGSPAPALIGAGDTSLNQSLADDQSTTTVRPPEPTPSERARLAASVQLAGFKYEARMPLVNQPRSPSLMERMAYLSGLGYRVQRAASGPMVHADDVASTGELDRGAFLDPLPAEPTPDTEAAEASGERGAKPAQDTGQHVLDTVQEDWVSADGHGSAEHDGKIWTPPPPIMTRSAMLRGAEAMTWSAVPDSSTPDSSMDATAGVDRVPSGAADAAKSPAPAPAPAASPARAPPRANVSTEEEEEARMVDSSEPAWRPVEPRAAPEQVLEPAFEPSDYSMDASREPALEPIPEVPDSSLESLPMPSAPAEAMPSVPAAEAMPSAPVAREMPSVPASSGGSVAAPLDATVLRNAPMLNSSGSMPWISEGTSFLGGQTDADVSASRDEPSVSEVVPAIPPNMVPASVSEPVELGSPSPDVSLSLLNTAPSLPMLGLPVRTPGDWSTDVFFDAALRNTYVDGAATQSPAGKEAPLVEIKPLFADGRRDGRRRYRLPSNGYKDPSNLFYRGRIQPDSLQYSPQADLGEFQYVVDRNVERIGQPKRRAAEKPEPKPEAAGEQPFLPPLDLCLPEERGEVPMPEEEDDWDSDDEWAFGLGVHGWDVPRVRSAALPLSYVTRPNTVLARGRPVKKRDVDPVFYAGCSKTSRRPDGFAPPPDVEDERRKPVQTWNFEDDDQSMSEDEAPEPARAPEPTGAPRSRAAAAAAKEHARAKAARTHAAPMPSAQGFNAQPPRQAPPNIFQTHAPPNVFQTQPQAPPPAPEPQAAPAAPREVPPQAEARMPDGVDLLGSMPKKPAYMTWFRRKQPKGGEPTEPPVGGEPTEPPTEQPAAPGPTMQEADPPRRSTAAETTYSATTGRTFRDGPPIAEPSAPGKYHLAGTVALPKLNVARRPEQRLRGETGCPETELARIKALLAQPTREPAPARAGIIKTLPLSGAVPPAGRILVVEERKAMVRSVM